MDLSPQEQNARFDFNFQVWRPSPTVNENGCYSLVNNYLVTSISISTKTVTEHVARVTPSPQHQLQFQPGDVLGFYVESHGTSSDGNNGVVLLNNGSHTSESVWFASIGTTAQTSQSGSCPYPVGTTGVLDTLTLAAPVISISTTAYYCPPSSSLQSFPSASVATSTKLILRLPQQTPTTSTPITMNTSITTGRLIAGVVVTIMIVCIAMVVITLAIIFVVKRHSGVKKTLDSTTTNSMALENQVYGKL